MNTHSPHTYLFNDLLHFEDHKFCPLSFSIDTYSEKCSFNCQYCYSSERHAILGKQITFDTLEETILKHLKKGSLPVLRIGTFFDPFSKESNSKKETLKLLTLLKKYQYPYVLFTKSPLIASTPYLEQLIDSKGNIQISLSCPDDLIRQKLEPNAPCVDSRLNAIKELIQFKVSTQVRINPLFPIYKDGTFSSNELPKSQELSIFNFDLLDQLHSLNVKHIILGFLHLTQKQMEEISTKISFDLSKLLTPDIRKKQQGFIYSEREILKYLQFIASYNQEIHFTFCHLGYERTDRAQNCSCFNDHGNIALHQQKTHWAQYLANYILKKAIK